MIGVARRILDSLLLDVKRLTHEVLTTLMAKVMSVMNSRPLVPVSPDPELPMSLTPATLLTMKTNQSVLCFQLDSFCPKDLYKKSGSVSSTLLTNSGYAGKMNTFQLYSVAENCNRTVKISRKAMWFSCETKHYTGMIGQSGSL